MTELDVPELKREFLATLKQQGLIILPGVLLILYAWVAAAHVLQLDVVFASRGALLMAAPVLGLGLFYPLLTKNGRSERVFIVNWFLLASFFNAWWEVPQVVFIDVFHEANQHMSLEKLAYFIPWWGYSSSDLDYFATSRYFVLAEVSFWVINLLSFAGLYCMLKGQELKAMLWYGACAVMQIYNVMAIFIPHGIIVERGGNVATDSVLAHLAFWIMNLLWVVAAAFAARFAYRRVMELARSATPSR